MASSLKLALLCVVFACFMAGAFGVTCDVGERLFTGVSGGNNVNLFFGPSKAADSRVFAFLLTVDGVSPTSTSGTFTVPSSTSLTLNTQCDSPTSICSSGTTASFNLNWSGDCSSFTISNLVDACAARNTLLTGLGTLTDSTKKAPNCNSIASTVWSSLYSEAGVTNWYFFSNVGTMLSVVGNLPGSNSPDFVNTHSGFTFSGGVLTINDKCGGQACSAAITGTYNINFDANCVAMSLSSSSDSCNLRRGILNGRTINLETNFVAPSPTPTPTKTSTRSPGASPASTPDATVNPTVNPTANPSVNPTVVASVAVSRTPTHTPTRRPQVNSLTLTSGVSSGSPLSPTSDDTPSTFTVLTNQGKYSSGFYDSPHNNDPTHHLPSSGAAVVYLSMALAALLAGFAVLL